VLNGCRAAILIATLVILMMAAWSPASAGPQDDPTTPPVAITPGGGGFLGDDERTYSATLTFAGAVADQTLESGQAAQALAAAAAARRAALSDTGSTAADGSAASTTAADTPPPPAPGSVDEARAIASSECAWRAAAVPVGDARWGGNDPAAGALLVNICNGPERYLYVPDPPPGALAAAPPPPPPDPAVLAQQAYTELTVPKPEAQRSPPETNSDPDNGGLPYTWVGLNTWVWVNNWQPLQRTVDLRGVSATVTATPTSLVFDPGNGDAAVTCPGPGRPWTEADGNTAPTGGGCGYVYRSVTANGPLTARTGITWSVAWTSNTGAGGAFPALTTQSDSTFLVEQIQVVVKR
jgi:hypothetical protein